MSIDSLITFLQRNFYHHEGLLSFSEFLRLQGHFIDSFSFVERCLFAFENYFCSEFQCIMPSNAQEFLSEGEHFVPQVELDYSEMAEPLNRVFGECLVKYIDVLGRKGCSRTALEYCKLLLGLCPKRDLQGSLLRIDYYALRAREYTFFLDFVEKFSQQIYEKQTDKISCLKLLPNILMSCALASKNVASSEEECKNYNEELE